MRLIVASINIPLAGGLDYFLARKILEIANNQMRRRGAIVQPLVRLYAGESGLDQTFAVKAFVTMIQTVTPDKWSGQQLDALRHCQIALHLSDAQLRDLVQWFDRGPRCVRKPIAADAAHICPVFGSVFDGCSGAPTKYDLRQGVLREHRPCRPGSWRGQGIGGNCQRDPQCALQVPVNLRPYARTDVDRSPGCRARVSPMPTMQHELSLADLYVRAVLDVAAMVGACTG